MAQRNMLKQLEVEDAEFVHQRILELIRQIEALESDSAGIDSAGSDSAESDPINNSDQNLLQDQNRNNDEHMDEVLGGDVGEQPVNAKDDEHDMPEEGDGDQAVNGNDDEDDMSDIEVAAPGANVDDDL